MYQVRGGVIFPRMRDLYRMPSSAQVLALLGVLFLIGGLALGCIIGVSFFGPLLAHGSGVQHIEGRIVFIGPGKDFVLKTATGAKLLFHCVTNSVTTCRASLDHMQRHLSEHALTDVYYVRKPGALGLSVVDVD